MTEEEQESLFNRWLRDHIGLLLKVVRGFAQSRHDQEDLFQDVLVGLWASIPNFRGDAKETTWIYRVAFNTALAWRRTETRRRKKNIEFLKSVSIMSDHSSTSKETPQQEMIDRMYDAIRQLSKIDASPAIMHLDGLSYQEMGEVLGISENYIGVKLNRIRKQLSERLQGVSDEL
jgi:RNA polymerase sigma-70 factor (ECF subfamily)